MIMTIKDLKPTAVWTIFDEITKVPRPSKKEEKIRKYILDFAKANGIDAKTDEVGNVVLSKPATPGKEDAPTVIMQGHMDMVAVKKNDCDIDLERDTWTWCASQTRKISTSTTPPSPPSSTENGYMPTTLLLALTTVSE